MVAEVLVVTGLTKRYGPELALNSVSLTLQEGETAALLGENGAGKSTLAKILAGVVRPDEGVIRLRGEEVSFSSPRDALDRGVAFIPQELVYVPRLTVAENICLGRLPTTFGLTSARRIRERAASDALRFGFDLPLNAEMGSLSLAEQQMVEILKALARDSALLVLDEPTAALNSEDSERLLTLMTSLANSGVAILYVSHRLDEVFRHCRTVHVLRNGNQVHSGRVADASPSEIITHILGRSETTASVRQPVTADAPVALEISGWSREAQPPIKDVSVTVRQGEIVGLYGLQGSGAETVAEALGGLHPDVVGETSVTGTRVGRITSPVVSRRAGIAYVPADRKSQGLVMVMQVYQALSLLVVGSMARFGVIRLGVEERLASRLSVDVSLRSRSPHQLVRELSGGNQQKVLVGSRLATGSKVLVLQEPTRGVDIGARREIHRLVRELANRGTGILVVTSDIDEALVMSDRLLIFLKGAIVWEILQPGPASGNEALHAAGGLT